MSSAQAKGQCFFLYWNITWSMMDELLSLAVYYNATNQLQFYNVCCPRGNFLSSCKLTLKWDIICQMSLPGCSLIIRACTSPCFFLMYNNIVIYFSANFGYCILYFSAVASIHEVQTKTCSAIMFLCL